MSSNIKPGPGSPGFRKPKKITRQDVVKLNAELGEKLHRMLEENIQLKAKLGGYTKVFVHMLGGEARVPAHGFAKEMEGLVLTAEPPVEGDDDPAFVYKLVPKDQATAETNAEIDAEVERRKAGEDDVS